MSRDEAYLIDMLVASRRACMAVENCTVSDFIEDWKHQSIVQHQLLILAEAAKRLSSEFRESHPHIRWKAIAGQRDVLIHQYDGVDAEALWRIVESELPPLIQFLESVVPQEQ